MGTCPGFLYDELPSGFARSPNSGFMPGYRRMKELIFEITEDESEGGFVARALGYSIITQADTWEMLRGNVREAVRCHFDEGKAPAVIRLHRVMDEVLALV